MVCIVFIWVCMIIFFDEKGGSLNTWGDNVTWQTLSDSWASILLPLFLNAGAIVVVALWRISLGQRVICKDWLLLMILMIVVILMLIVRANLIHTFWTVLNQRPIAIIHYLLLLLLYKQIWCRPWQLSFWIWLRNLLLHHITSIILVQMVSIKEAILLWC